MRRHDLTRASLIFSLVCMTLFGGYVVGAMSPQAASSRSQEAESSRILEGSKVTLQYVATAPGSAGDRLRHHQRVYSGSARDLSYVGARSSRNETWGGKEG